MSSNVSKIFQVYMFFLYLRVVFKFNISKAVAFTEVVIIKLQIRLVGKRMSEI